MKICEKFYMLINQKYKYLDSIYIETVKQWTPRYKIIIYYW